MASINHSGTLEKGHYWAIVKYLNSGDQLSCNDKVVLTVPQHSLNNTNPFLQEELSIVKLVQRGIVFLNIVFGYDDPTYYPSPGRGIQFAHSIFRNLHLCKTRVFMRGIARGLASLGQVFESRVNQLSTVVRLSVRLL